MGMNIKNEEAHQLALEISQATGETLTATVLRALRLLKEKELARPRTPEEKIAALEALRRKYPVTGKDPGDDFLYDERGLPHGS